MCFPKASECWLFMGLFSLSSGSHDVLGSKHNIKTLWVTPSLEVVATETQGPQHQQFGIADNNACSQSLLPTLNSEALALQPWIFFRRWIVFCSMQTWWVSAPLLPMQGQWQNSADFWVPEDVDLIWWKKKKKKGVRKIVSQFIAQVDWMSQFNMRTKTWDILRNISRLRLIHPRGFPWGDRLNWKHKYEKGKIIVDQRHSKLWMTV